MTLPRRRPRPFKGPSRRKQISVRLEPETLDYLDREALSLSGRPPFADITASDILRVAIREYRERHPEVAPAEPHRRCDIIEMPTGTFCTSCGSRGPAGEDPECLSNG